MSTPFQVYALLWEGLTGQAVKHSRALELLERRFAAPATSRVSFGKAVKQRRKGASEKVILILDELLCPACICSPRRPFSPHR